MTQMTTKHWGEEAVERTRLALRDRHLLWRHPEPSHPRCQEATADLPEELAGYVDELLEGAGARRRLVDVRHLQPLPEERPPDVEVNEGGLLVRQPDGVEEGTALLGLVTEQGDHAGGNEHLHACAAGVRWCLQLPAATRLSCVRPHSRCRSPASAACMLVPALRRGVLLHPHAAVVPPALPLPPGVSAPEGLCTQEVDRLGERRGGRRSETLVG